MHGTFFLVLRRMRTPLVVLICAYAISIVGFLIIPGADNEGNVWRMDFFHAFYFVSYMGSTIGFGEIPYPFTDAQRLWTLLCIYLTVISWLYAIGTMISLFQNPAFRASLTYNSFIRRVKRIREPYYIVCGCGDTGTLLIKALSRLAIHCVALDIDKDKINGLEIQDLDIGVPALCADVSFTETLKAAGLHHRYCAGVIALTSDDEVNLKVAIASKLLNPGLPVICRAQTRDTEANMASFGTDHTINAFDTFADYLAMTFTSPGMYLLYDWLSSTGSPPLSSSVSPPNGRWILCGFGRFGKAIHKRLIEHNNDTTIIELKPDITGAPSDSIIGRGTEADTLHEADIESAVGIVAGTDNDANNLSIVMTAMALNPDLFVVTRQNRLRNEEIFTAAKVNITTHHSKIITGRALSLITTPLTAEFLEQAEHYERQWVDDLVERIRATMGDKAPHVWWFRVNMTECEAVCNKLDRYGVISIDCITRDPYDRKRKLACVPLMIKRENSHIMLPDSAESLQNDDQIMCCGEKQAKRLMKLTVNDPAILHYLLTGKRQPSGWLWRKLRKNST